MNEEKLNFLKSQMESPYATVRESTWGFHSDPQPDYGITNDEGVLADAMRTKTKINKANGTEVTPVTSDDDSFISKIKSTNAFKKYFYSKDDVLLEAKNISNATKIPVNAILADAKNLDKARDIYNYQQKIKDPDSVYKAYPELSTLAQKSDTDAAIALHNLRNVRQTQGIVEAAKTGWELDSLMNERGRLGYAAMNGKSLTDADLKRLEEIEKQQKESKELPGLFEDPMGAIVGGTVQSGKMMLRNMLNGQKLGMYGAAAGAIIGGAGAAATTGGAGLMAGAAAGSRFGYSIGSRIGMAQDMYDEIAGNNYLDYKKYKDKNGHQLLTDNQARAYAAASAALETGIEFSNAERILNIVKGGAEKESLKKIIEAAKDNKELRSLLTAYVRDGVKNIGTVAVSESAEEGVQEMSNRIITDIAAYNNPDGDIPTYSVKDILVGGLEASWQALATSIGFGVSAHAVSTTGYARRMAAALEIKTEEQKANMHTANGISMLRSLAEDIKSNELFKKSPEVYHEVLENQLKGTELETVNIDTEIVLNQEGGYELLKEAADKAGLSEEQFNQIVETKADLKINTAEYVEKYLPNDLGAKLEDYITFDDIGECLARNRMYASRLRREMDKVLAFEERQREDALNNFLEQNFPDAAQREVAEAVIRRFPDNPKEGVKEIRKSLQEKIDTPLNEIIAQLKEGVGNGVSVIAVDADGKPTSWEHSDHGRGVRVSNNAPWYQKWYKEHGRKPTEKEYRDLAYDIYTGHNSYGLLGWENNSGEEDQWYKDNEAAMEATQEAIKRLDALTPQLEKIDPGELTITEGLSEEAFEVYQEMRKQLGKAPSKEVRQAAQMNAILFARMADRMAEWHRQAGQTKYTALNFARSIGLNFGGRPQEGLRQEGLNGLRYKASDVNSEVNKFRNSKAISVEKDVVQKIEGSSAISQALKKFEELYSNEQKVDSVLGTVIINKKSLKNSLAHGFSQKKLDASISLVEGMKQASYIGSIEDLDNKNIDNHFFAYKINYSGQENIVFCRIKENAGQPMKLYIHEVVDMDTLKKRSSSLNETASLENGSVSRQASEKMSTPRGLALYSSILNQFLENVNQSYDQKEYNSLKAAQLEIIERNNKMTDDYHTGIRSVDDILTAEEALNVTQEQLDEYEVEGYSYPDFTLADGKKALKTGKITLYSSSPIKPGAFVSPSRMMAEDYAGGGKIYSKKVPLDEVAFINADEGQYAPVEAEIYDQKAWHGTAYNFERFDIRKIGAGVGDQVHGWGLYFAKDRKISEAYKEVLGVSADRITLNGEVYIINEYGDGDWAKYRGEHHLSEEVTYGTALNTALNAIRKEKSKAGAIKELQERIAGLKINDRTQKTIDNLKEAINIIEQADVKYENLSRLLEVDIPESDVMLDEQKHYEEQPEKVYEALNKMLEDLFVYSSFQNEIYSRHKGYIRDLENFDTLSGRGLYRLLSVGLGGDKEASLKLNEYGIKGITYEGKKDGRCFVVFDDKAIDIIERYNQAAGERAMTANAEKLQEAKDMLAQAEAAEEEPDMKAIYKKTGWHLGADGRWRFEIPDNLDKINFEKLAEEGSNYLKYIYDNTALYDAYPWLAYVRVSAEEMDRHTGGYAKGENKIGLNLWQPEEEIKKTLIHEIQHIIQHYEGFATGGSPKNVDEQMLEQFKQYSKDANRIHHKGDEYMKFLSEYDEAEFEHFMEKISDEEFQKYEDRLAAYKEELLPEEAEKIEKLKEQRVKLHRQISNAYTTKYDNYKNLHGEQEARLASKKAELYTEGAGEQEITDAVVNGINDFDAIVVFGGKSYNMDSYAQSAMRQENKRYVLNHDGNIDWGYINAAKADNQTEIKKAPVRMQIGYQVGKGEAGAGYTHIVRRHTDFIKAKGYKNVSEAIYDVLNNADFMVSLVARDGRERLALVKDLTPHTSVSLMLDYTEDNGEKYYTVVSLLPQSSKQVKIAKEKALSFNGSVRPYTATGSGAFFTPTETKAGIEGGSFAGKDNAFTVSIADADKYVNEYTYEAGEQKGLYKIKGQSIFKATGEKIISLFEAADQSTFMHEMAHVYLHDMLQLAKLPDAPKQLLADVKTLNDWASWRPETFDKEYKGTALEREFKKLHEQICDATKFGYLKIDGRDVSVEQLKMQWAQERFARGFENYLREGKAPAESIKSIFRRFKEWLGKIYRAFVQIGGAPSKEVRAVMDRMIASEEEIDIAMTKKGVDDFTRAGGMDYLADNAKQVYDRMVQRAKEEAKEKVLKIALKDIKEDYRRQEKEFFEQEEAEYREKLMREPVFVIQQHIKNNPNLSTSAICQTLGMSVEDYVAKLKEYGGSVDAAVKSHMKEFKKNIDNSGFDAKYFREKAEEVVEESRYRKLAAAMELNAFEGIAKAQRRINVQAVASMKLSNDEKGVMGTVNKLTAQSQKIDQLKAEKKEEAAKHRTEKKELREKLEGEKKEGIAKQREEKERIIANVRGLRDAALKHYKEYVDYVEMKLETMPIGEANNYQMWRRKSAQAQHNSERALATAKWDLAIKYKRAQIIYDMFADKAVRNAKQIKKLEDGLVKKRQTIIKNKNISANERYAYNHLLYVFGFVDADAPMPPTYQQENGFMGVLQKSDAPREIDGLFLECPFFTADGFCNLPEWLLSAAMGDKQRENGHQDLSNDQVKMLAQVLNIIYKRGADDMKLLHSMDVATVEEAIAGIEAQARQRIVEPVISDPTGATKKTWDEEAQRAISDLNQFLTKPEVELKKLGSLAVKYIYEPLKLAADKELQLSQDMYKKMEAVFGVYTPEELRDVRNVQKYKFGTSMLTREQVIMIALNWGTEINAKRVIDGYHVTEHDVRNVLAELTEAEWNLVDSIWKLYDEHWDDLCKIEAHMTGAVLEKQPGKAFTILGRDGNTYTLDGGYFPIKYDPLDAKTQEQQADAAAKQQAGMSNIAMSLGKGFLKERSNATIERRLDLRFDVISKSLADVIHLVAFREPVRDVRRIVLNDSFRNLATRYLGDAAYKNIKKWTSDCWMEEPISTSRLERAAAKLRNAQTMGVMGYRVSTALLNLANVPSVAHYMGAAELFHALKKFYSAPRRYSDFIFQRSVFMAERSETMDSSISDAIKKESFGESLPGVGKLSKYLKEHAFKMLTWTDLMLALPLWEHEYEKAYNAELENGNTPEQAQAAGVAAGDAGVRWCFGSGRTVDKAAVQRKTSEFMKQLTMYYSYQSTVYNAINYKIWEARMGYKQAVSWADANKNKELMQAVIKAGNALLMWTILPAVITTVLRAGMSGDDDDLKLEKFLKGVAKESLMGWVGAIPVLRDAVPYFLAKAFDDKKYAPKIPLESTIEQTDRVISSIYSDKKTFVDMMRESGKLLTQAAGVPGTLVDAFTTTLSYLETGFDADVADYLRALIFDKQLKKDKK